MQILNEYLGVLKMDVSSEDNYISAGTYVLVEDVVDNFKNISTIVTSIDTEVRLSFYDTDVSDLLSAE